VFDKRSHEKPLRSLRNGAEQSDQARRRLQSTSNIRFDGEMNGDLTTEGDLSVGEGGRVKGNVTGRNVVVGGAFRAT